MYLLSAAHEFPELVDNQCISRNLKLGGMYKCLVGV